MQTHQTSLLLLFLLLLPAGAAAGTGTIKDVEHVVVFMQENRAFDHYVRAGRRRTG